MVRAKALFDGQCEVLSSVEVDIEASSAEPKKGKDIVHSLQVLGKMHFGDFEQPPWLSEATGVVPYRYAETVVIRDCR